MDDILGQEEFLLSAFSKLKLIQGNVHEVTLGPDASWQKHSVKVILTPVKPKRDPQPTRRTEPEESDSDTISELIRIKHHQTQEDLRERIQRRAQKFEDFSKEQQERGEQEWLQIQQKFVRDMHERERGIVLELEEYERMTRDEHVRLAKHYRDLEQQRKQREQELQQKEAEKRILYLNMEKIKKTQQEFRMVYQQIIPTLKRCVNNEKLKSELGESFTLLKLLPQKIEEITLKCKQGKVVETDVEQACELLNTLTKLKALIEDMVEKINKEKEIQDIQAQAQPIVNPLEEPKPPPPPPQPQPTEPQVQTTDSDQFNITQYISLSNLRMYTEYLSFVQTFAIRFKNLEEDASLKQFRFDCKKAVNIPVNSLSGVNSEHIQDKYNRLHNLLNGKNVLVSDKVINVSQHPQGVPFCMDLLARKFVLQSDLMVSSNPESAFCYATVMVSLWNEFPDFGKLLLAHFYKCCPYLVPYYAPRQVGESDEEFYLKQGYQYNDGQIEKQDKFLKRMTGIMRLYSALLIVYPKRGQSGTPHNIGEGWRWLGSILRLEPQIDISATMMHTFLETVGFQMEAVYGKAFHKLLRIVVEKFIPQCRNMSSGGATCEDDKDCCGGCCMSGICRDIYRDCRKADDPCLERFCPPDQECYIFQPKDCGGCGPYPDCRDAPPALQETTAKPPRLTSLSLKLIGNSHLVLVNLIMLLMTKV